MSDVVLYAAYILFRGENNVATALMVIFLVIGYFLVPLSTWVEEQMEG